MRIHSDFTGGNIIVEKKIGNDIFVERDLRDTDENISWFYWAFCVEDAQNETLTFHFVDKRLGYWGPAVSHDLKTWHWLNQIDGNTFTYTFGPHEDKVYFAHHMLYHPTRFIEFAQDKHLFVEEWCVSRKGNSIPMVRFGEGDKKILLTARHHACESTGNYVMEGVIEYLLQHPLEGYECICIPFVDYDGVLNGDQGKARVPHDHARDYEGESIYPEVGAIREYAKNHNVIFGFDFHSPWHIGEENDKCYMVQKSIEKLPALNAFGEILEQSMTKEAFQYKHENALAPNTLWNNVNVATFSTTLLRLPSCKIAFTLETAYFGENDNVFSQANAVETGRCFAKALQRYILTAE